MTESRAKNKGFLLTTGMIAFLSSLAINGIPFGSSPLEIISLIVFFLGLFAVLIIGLSLKKDKLFMITTIIYTAISVLLIMYVEASSKDYILSGIGFLPGLGLSITGLVRTKQGCKALGCYIINGIALAAAVASLCLAVFSGKLIMLP
jgi:hypothetical protein